MAEEFEGGVCGGNWGAWNSSRNLFASSPCSLATNDIAGSCFGWPNHDVMLTARSSDDSAGSASDGVIQDVQKPNGLQMIGITTHDNWNQDLLNDSGRSQENYSNFLNMNYEQQSSKVDNNFSDQINSSPCFPSSTTTTTTGFPLNSPSYNYTSSTLLQTLFDTQLDQEDSQPQQSFLDNYLPNSNGFLPPKPSPMLTQQPSLWNVPAAAAAAAPSTFTQSHHFHLPPSLNNKSGPNPPPTFGAKHQQAAKESVAKKGSNEAAAAFKRPRIETPSPLPTFKVRKEKLGDRITALQQLVSPFGKTDTASVLHEAIEYIKFLHDQVNALSTPYLKYGSPLLQRQQVGDKSMDGEGLIKDLNSRGLCLVPLSSTFPVATETPSDFWTPTFGRNLK